MKSQTFNLTGKTLTILWAANPRGGQARDLQWKVYMALQAAMPVTIRLDLFIKLNHDSALDARAIEYSTCLY